MSTISRILPRYDAPAALYFGAKAGKAEASVDASPAAPSNAALKAFRAVLLDCVNRETTQAQNKAQRDLYAEFEPACKMWGQCVPVAMAVKDKFGGELLRYELEVTVKGQKEKQIHYANHIGGVDIDLTSDQYNGDGLHAVDDSSHGVTESDGSGKLPVSLGKVLSKKTMSDFHFGRIKGTTILLGERLKQKGAL